MSFKNYLYSLRFFIVFSALAFLASIVTGYFVAKMMPDKIEESLQGLKDFASIFLRLDPFLQVVFIFLNNALKGFLVILFGVLFGIFPFFSLFANGQVLGILAFTSQEKLSPGEFLLYLLPHGIFEVPAFILACAIGMKIGKAAFLKLFFSKGEAKKEFLLGIKFFIKYLVPLFAIAAVIEIFITPRLI